MDVKIISVNYILTLDIQSYLLKFCFWMMFWETKHLLVKCLDVFGNFSGVMYMSIIQIHMKKKQYQYRLRGGPFMNDAHNH